MRHLPTNDTFDAERRILARAMSALFAISLLTGYYLGLIMLGTIDGDEHVARGTHLSALLGAPLLAAYGWSLPALGLTSLGRRRLTWGFVYVANANWFFNLLRANLKVTAMQMNGDPANDVLFVVMNLAAAAPAIACAVAWVYGTWRKPIVN